MAHTDCVPWYFPCAKEGRDDPTEADLKVLGTQDIGARDAIYIFNRISFAIAKGVRAQ
nr:hypothetical protein [Tanacetum cinerariifolium]